MICIDYSPPASTSVIGGNDIPYYDRGRPEKQGPTNINESTRRISEQIRCR